MSKKYIKRDGDKKLLSTKTSEHIYKMDENSKNTEKKNSILVL